MDKIVDYVSGKEVDAKPEEVQAVQPFSKILVEDYGYPKSMIETHPQRRVYKYPSDKTGYPVDIAVSEDGNLKIIVECKRQERKDGINQLKTYLTLCEAYIGVWFNGKESVYIRKIVKQDSVTFEEMPAIPKYKQKISEIGLYKRKDLRPTHNLKEIFTELRGYIVGNSVGVNRDEIIAKEMIHLILCKIYDERFTKPDDMVTFRVSEDDSPEDVKKRIDGLFKSVKGKYPDVLSEQDTIDFDGDTLRHIIGKIQNFCFQDTDRDTVGDAFEVFIGYSLKGSQGQFFTPQNVIRTLVEAVNPKIDDVIIDPSCGSCGFLVESLKRLWTLVDQQAKEYNWNQAAALEEKNTKAVKNIRGIEKDSFLTKVGKSYMAILGDGKGGIFCEDSLENPAHWKAETQRNVKLNSFDVSFSNPPFGKDIKVNGKEKLSQYELAKKTQGNKTKLVEEGNVSTLFLERNMQLLKTGGVLAIILPETYFHAPSQKPVREFIYRHNIKWIIDLPHNTFRPHNNAKCIAIVIQKDIAQQKYINMAVIENIGHDHNGLPVYKIVNGQKTNEILDDTGEVIEEIKKMNDDPNCPDGKLAFKIDSTEVKNKDVLVPRYYWKSRTKEIKKNAEKEGIELVSLQKLIDDGVLAAFDGNGSPASEYKGTGVYPYIRVKDIVNWQVYTDPTALIPEEEYNRLYKEDKKLKPKDILYVRRGSYRIGSVAMVSPYDLDVILTREILVLRVLKPDNEYNITPEYLMYALSHKIVQKQAENKIFVDTTLPNIADRWREIQIPVYKDENKFKQLSEKAENIVSKHWEASRDIDELKQNYDVYNT